MRRAVLACEPPARIVAPDARDANAAPLLQRSLMTPDPDQDCAADGTPQLLLPIALNALRWLAADERMPSIGQGEPSVENLLDFLRGPFARASVEDCVDRYRRASSVDRRLFALPTHERLARGLLNPLHNAKAEFVLGHYLSCVGLCGVVTEVVCVLRFDCAEFQCGGGPLDEVRQKELWGRPFGKLYQGQRVGALHALGLIDDATHTRLQVIATKRNRYMHIYAQAGGSEADDAFEVYAATCEVVASILGVDVRGTSLVFHPDILRFLQR